MHILVEASGTAHLDQAYRHLPYRVGSRHARKITAPVTGVTWRIVAGGAIWL
jgi:hypothetical protein